MPPQNFDWTPGLSYDPDEDVEAYLVGYPKRERLLEILAEAHSWFGKANQESLPQEVKESKGFLPAYNLQPDVPFPERVPNPLS